MISVNIIEFFRTVTAYRVGIQVILLKKRQNLNSVTLIPFEINGTDFIFTVNGDNDNVGGSVVNSTLSDGAINTPINTQLRISYGESLSAICLQNATVELVSATGTVAGTASLTNNQRTVDFTPTDSLDIDTSYTLSISGLCDYAGNSIADYSSSFTTGSASEDTTGPTVAITPTNRSIDVGVDSTIVFSFDEPIDPTTVTDISIDASGLGAVPGNYTFNVDNTEVIFTSGAVGPSIKSISIGRSASKECV